MAGVEVVTRGPRAAGMPWQSSRPCLFVPITVDGWVWGIYPQRPGTWPPT